MPARGRAHSDWLTSWSGHWRGQGVGPRALARMPRVRQGFLPPVGMAWDPGWRWVLALGAGAGLPCCRPALSQNWAAESHCRMGAVTHQNRHCNQYQACTCMRASLYLFPGCRGPAPRLPGSQPMPVPCCLGPAPRLHGSQRVPIPWSMRLPHRASEDPAQLRVLIVVPVPAQLDCPSPCQVAPVSQSPQERAAGPRVVC